MNSPAPSIEPCPDLDALAALVDGAVSEARRARLEAHLVGCEACRTTVAASARAVETVERTSGGAGAAGAQRGHVDATVRPWWRRIAVAAAAVVVVALGAFFALRAKEPADPLSAAFAALREARADLFGDARPLSKDELAAGGSHVLRGGIEWMTPGGTTTEERPTFEWADVDGATGYRLTITDAEGVRVVTTTAKTARLEGASLPKPLVAGADYVWKVTALDAPTPADGATALHVATAAERAAVRELVTGISGAVGRDLVDLVTAQTLLRRGFAAEALPYARRHAQRAPHDATARDTLALALRRLVPAASGR